MDIAELVIRIQASAEGVEETLQSVKQQMQTFTASVSAKPAEIKIKSDSAKAVQANLEGITKAKGEMVKPARMSIDTNGATQNVNALGETLEQFTARLQAQSDQANAAFDQQVSMLRKQTQANQEAAQAATENTQAITEMGQTAAVLEPVVEAVEKTAEGFQKTGEAATQAGVQAQTAGVQGASGAAVATTATVAWTAATKVLKGVLIGVGSALGGMVITAVVSGIQDWVSGMVHAREEAEKLRQETVRVNKEAFQASGTRLSTFDELSKRYAELSEKTTLSMAEYQELGAIQRELASAYGVTATTVDGLTKSIDAYTEALKKNREEQEQQLAADAKKVAKDSYVAAHTAELTAAYQKRAELQTKLERFQSGKSSAWELASITEEFKNATNPYEAYVQSLKDGIANEEKILQRHNALWETLFVDSMADMKSHVLAKGGEWNENLAAFVEETFTIDLKKFVTEEEATAFVDQLVKNVTKAAQSTDIMADVGNMQSLTDAVLWGGKDPEEAAAEADAYLESLTKKFNQLFEGLDPEQAAMATNFLVEALTGVNMNVDSGKGTAAQQYFTALREGGVQAMLAGQQLGAFGTQVLKTDQTIGKAKNMTGIAKEWKAAKDELAKTTKNTDAWNKAVAKADKTAQKFGGSVDELTGSTEGADEAFAAYAANLKAKEASIEADIANLEAQLYGVDAASQIEGNATMNGAQAQALIDQLKQKLAELRVEMAAAGISPGPASTGRGGGGGGKKDSAEEAAREAERLRQEAIRRDYDYIAHKRHLNEITLEEELKMLEKIRQAHQLNAEEIMEWEEKVYDLKKELRERDAASIDKMGDAVIDALAARYEAMQEAEIERLDASRKAWEDWRDDSVKAINDQIAALDKLMQTEDREKQDAEELRKIAKLKQDIEFEQDEYNRMKLQQQLEQALQSREERLRRLEIEDQKEALRESITAIEEKAEAEITALDAEQEAIEAAYAERMKAAALRAEAEKLIMKGTQQELIDLIGEFAPEYDALGKTLGEKLLDGFKKKAGDVVDWFKQLNDTLYAIQEKAASEATAAAQDFYKEQSSRTSGDSSKPPATVVNQTVNFNEPVESAGQAARRIAQTNAELAELLYGG